MKETFKDLYLKNKIEFDKIDEYIEEWGNAREEDTNATLREYLGLSTEEEDIWIEESDEALKEILDKEKEEIRKE